MSDLSEIVKSGAFDKFVDLMHKLAGPSFEEVGLMWGEKVRYYRLKNAIEIGRKTRKLIEDAGNEPREIPPRILYPLMEAASLEEDESLQQLWAGLLATASDQSDTLSPSFIETLKQLSPTEACGLQKLFHWVLTQFLRFPPLMNAEWGPSTDTYERLGLIRRSYGLVSGDRSEQEVGYMFEFTKYGVAFMNACEGPRPSE